MPEARHVVAPHPFAGRESRCVVSHQRRGRVPGATRCRADGVLVRIAVKVNAAIARQTIRRSRKEELMRNHPSMNAALALVGLVALSVSSSADFTAAQVRELLATSASQPAKLAGKDLSDLDLSNIDFKGADLSGANLFGSRLVAANLAGAKLTRANLNGAWLMGADFAGADLSGSSMLSLVILGGEVKEKPNFAGANLSGVRMIADLATVNLRGANLSGAKLGVDMKNQGMGLTRNDLSGA